MVSGYFIVSRSFCPVGCLGKGVCKARAKIRGFRRIADLAGKVDVALLTVMPPEHPGCATLEQVVTIGTAPLPTAWPSQKTAECPLQPRQQERRAFLPRLAQPLQIVSPASEPIQGMEVVRQHVIPRSRTVFSTLFCGGTIE
jgi:hypothetical protein